MLDWQPLQPVAQLATVATWCTLGVSLHCLLPQNKEDDTAIKVADFGVAKQLDVDKFKTFCGSPQYLAPEVRVHCAYGRKLCG